ncbi:unnamed protein product [Moneuplotes crassus]|uniref:Uncharacterized protein n=1 Tax=Euplotes crassus TaxID=5936 RepID=A0AAD1XDF1_EUPCR|nr:unnamed protein product [Moneuplotes crassus]
MSRQTKERVLSFDRNEFYKNADQGFDVPPLNFEKFDCNGWTTFAKVILTKENGFKKYVNYAKKYKMGIVKKKFFATNEKKKSLKFIKTNDEKDIEPRKTLTSKGETSDKKAKRKVYVRSMSKKPLRKKRNYLQDERERIKKIQSKMLQDRKTAKKSRMGLLQNNYSKNEMKRSDGKAPKTAFYMSDRINTLAQPRENFKEKSSMISLSRSRTRRNSPKKSSPQSRNGMKNSSMEGNNSLALPYLYNREIGCYSTNPKMSSQRDMFKESSTESLIERKRLRKLRAQAMKLIYAKQHQ